MFNRKQLAVLCFIAGIMFLLALFQWTGVSVAAPHDSLGAVYTNAGEPIHVYVFIDPDTGAEYLVTEDGGITPRMDEDGQLYLF